MTKEEEKQAFKEIILGKLDEIHNKKFGKLEPNYVILTELSFAISKETKAILNALYFDKEIIVGETLNDKYIIRKTWENSVKQ